MRAPVTADQINEWFTSELELLLDKEYFYGKTADTFYNIVLQDCCTLKPGDNVGEKLECLYDSRSGLFRWLHEDFNDSQLESITSEIIDADYVQWEKETNLSHTEYMREVRINYFVENIVNFFCTQWENQFGKSTGFKDIVAQ